VALVYDANFKAWSAEAKTLLDHDGEKSTGKMTGIVFPVTATGIYRIMGVLENGDYMTLTDRSLE